MKNKIIGVIVHTHMEISQGISVCSYLYLKQSVIFFFFLLHLDLYYDFPTNNFGFSGYCFSNVLMYIIRLFKISDFLVEAFITINLPLKLPSL
jgi:hypothetical protein